MDILDLLNKVKNGEMSPEDAALHLKKEPFEDLGFAKVDHHRRILKGVAEVIYGAGKTDEQIVAILESLKEDDSCIIVTRVNPDTAAFIENSGYNIEYRLDAKICIVGKIPEPSGSGFITVVSAGTSDIPVAEEAAVTAEALGNRVERLYDVGVAGIHRLLSNLDPIMKARVVIVVAGMEGALASVVGGLADSPVIAVPTSVGYGASFGGVSALLAMMNSCASGVSVVNIDNGFGAGYLAGMINRIGN